MSQEAGMGSSLNSCKITSSSRFSDLHHFILTTGHVVHIEHELVIGRRRIPQHIPVGFKEISGLKSLLDLPAVLCQSVLILDFTSSGLPSSLSLYVPTSNAA